MPAATETELLTPSILLAEKPEQIENEIVSENARPSETAVATDANKECAEQAASTLDNSISSSKPFPTKNANTDTDLTTAYEKTGTETMVATPLVENLFEKIREELSAYRISMDQLGLQLGET